MSLLLWWTFSVDSVDTEISNVTLGAFAECLEDKVSYGEVLDLFEAALATLDYGEHFDGCVRSYPDTPAHPRQCEKYESESYNCNGNIEDHDVRVCDISAEDESDEVEADNRHDSG